MTKKLSTPTVAEAGRALRAKELTVRELWDACVTAAKEKEGLNAFREVFPADQEAIARAQARIDNGTAVALTGIPVATKDNILIEGKIASASSKILENYVATYDSTVVKKLKEADALLFGRTNMDEFAMGSSTENSAYGPVKNPLDETRVPGGSSGGSAAVVAAGIVPIALGTDTGGSIRQPAAHCGLVGLKPTYGAVSRSGLIAMGSSLDQAGPLAHTVADAEVTYDAIAGHDPLDATSIDDATYPARAVPKKFRIGVPRHLLEKGIDPDVLVNFENTLAALKKEGHEVVDVSLPTSPYALAAYYVVMPAEVSTNLARLDGMRYGRAVRGKTLLDDYVMSRSEGFGPETRRRILLGTFVLSSGYIDAYYRKAEATRTLLRDEYDAAFEKCDVVAFPTTPSPAFRFGEKSDPVAMYLEDIFTVTADLTGMPALSVPMGSVERDGSVLPTGIHFTAAHGAERALFRIGEAVEACGKL